MTSTTSSSVTSGSARRSLPEVENLTGLENKYADAKVYPGIDARLTGCETGDREAKLYLQLDSILSEIEMATVSVGVQYVFQVDQPMSSFSATIPATISYNMECTALSWASTSIDIVIEQLSEGRWTTLASRSVYHDEIFSIIKATKRVDTEIQLKANFQNVSLEPDDVYRLEIHWSAETVVPILRVPSGPFDNDRGYPLGFAFFVGNHSYGTGSESSYALLDLKAAFLGPSEETKPIDTPNRSSELAPRQLPGTST